MTYENGTMEYEKNHTCDEPEKPEQIQAVISILHQTGPNDFEMHHHSKTFDKAATIQAVEDWAKSYGDNMTIFCVKFATKD